MNIDWRVQYTSTVLLTYHFTAKLSIANLTVSQITNMQNKPPVNISVTIRRVDFAYPVNTKGRCPGQVQLLGDKHEGSSSDGIYGSKKS
jgi:hypothetical protein